VSHTPGPWKVIYDNGDYYVRGDGATIADCTSWSANTGQPNPPREVDANARLIAAAPEMLEALKALHDETADYITRNHLGDAHHNRAMQLADAAIRKAEEGL
jgi:hypothetical protein